MQRLVDEVLALDSIAIETAREAGSAALADLLALTHRDDCAVRRLALSCLEEIPSPEASRAFVGRVADADRMVRSIALRGLRARPDLAIAAELLGAYECCEDPTDRRDIALVLGVMPDVDAAALCFRWEHEPESVAREGCVVALARLGVSDAQRAFVEGLLGGSDSETRVRMLDHCEYLRAAWLLRPLASLLVDDAPVLRVGVDGEEGPEYKRTCDIVLELMLVIASPALTTVGNRSQRRVNYDAEQLDEVKRWARACGAEV